MSKYNYLEAIRKDIINYIKENNITITEDSFEEIYDDVFNNDSITGNLSGSYTMNSYQAEENIYHNLDLVRDSCIEFSHQVDFEKHGAEYYDVLIRCYLVGEILNDVINELM